MVVYKNRAFLALSRSSCHKNVTGLTIIETNWNGNNLEPKSRTKSFFKQTWKNCDELQNVVSLDVEPKKYRLWILDKGSEKCLPKLVIYNLHGNYEEYITEFYDFANEDLSYLTVDPLNEFNTLCYIGMKTSNKIIVFSWNNRNWTVVSFSSGQVHPQRIAISTNNLHMFFTYDKSDDLLALNLSDVRNVGRTDVTQNHKLNIAYIGKKLGPSTGMVIDVLGGLNYFLSRDYAVVRWDINNALLAEHHDVLLQSFDVLPNVSHLFKDPHNNVWALVNPTPSFECISEDYVKHSEKSKVVPISKFLKLGFKTKILKLW
ncbi:hypothetical protein FQR65_LT12054 [Abscondita terminalis]|nr:hypothetical protein FQR65_LT12054 [Abscondita terminalis]